MIKKYLEAGKVVGTHGINGDLRVEVWCDTVEFLCSFKTLYMDQGRKEININSLKSHKNIAIMHIENVDTIEEAEKIRGKILYINRKNVKLPEGEYFIQDIIGLEVVNAQTNQSYGKITEVFKTGANDVYQITSEENKNYLIPVIKEVILNIDVSNNKILISPMKGLFEDEI